MNPTHKISYQRAKSIKNDDFFWKISKWNAMESLEMPCKNGEIKQSFEKEKCFIRRKKIVKYIQYIEIIRLTNR